MLKCSNCGSTNMGVIAPESGMTYGLVSYDKTKTETSIDGTLQVDVYACLDCSAIMLKAVELTKR